jgi:hypothetical protein
MPRRAAIPGGSVSEAPVITSAVTNAPGVITIAWAHSGEDGPVSFFVERQQPPLIVGPFLNNVDFFSNMGLEPSTVYAYRVCAIYPDGSRDCSDFISVRTMAPEQPQGALPPPTITAQAITTDSITIHWTGKNYGHVNLRWRKVGESEDRPQIPINQNGRTEGSRHFPNLEPNSSYLFIIQGCERTIVGTDSCGRFSLPVAVRTAALPLPPPPMPPPTVYAVMKSGVLLWNRHLGHADGTFRWASGNSKPVGGGWKVLHAFAGGDGVLYAVLENGDLMWNRHLGRSDGTPRWAAPNGIRVGIGWQGAAHVFAGHEGVIYSVFNNGQVLWNRHEGRENGEFKWALPTGRNVANGVNKMTFFRARHVFAGGAPGIIYALMDDNDLLWFRHTGWSDGSVRWEGEQGKVVGVGWQVKTAFAARNTTYVYAVMPDGQLMWNLHAGWDDGTFRWASDVNKPVGNGWDVTHGFAD